MKKIVEKNIKISSTEVFCDVCGKEIHKTLGS